MGKPDVEKWQLVAELQRFSGAKRKRALRTNILSEMRDNRRAFAKEEQELARMQQEAQDLVAAIHRLEGNRKSPPEQIQLT